MLTLSLDSLAQQRKIEYPHTVFWSELELNEMFTDTLGVGLDIVIRRKNAMNQGSMFDYRLRESIRPWFHYQFSQNARFSLSPIGYFVTNEFLAKPEDWNRPEYHEFRISSQFFHHLKQWEGRIIHTWRYRHEVRMQYNPITETYRLFQRFMFRYRIRVLLNSTDFYDDQVLYAVASNEFGLNFGEGVVFNTFNQNRFYAGMGIRLLNALRIELRYINHYRTRGSTGFEFDTSQGLMIGLYIDQLSSLGQDQYTLPIRFYD
ncbi:MAG: DUF2490 domain-containing protein [Bacteroidota bacterium]|nr:DUF2490 domain-containing protein [Candidatus Kapabacteria bacterium]MDW8219909.1 DUF2490 domain-containing protein [Bacteroidota bacterium]